MHIIVTIIAMIIIATGTPTATPIIEIPMYNNSMLYINYRQDYRVKH